MTVRFYGLMAGYRAQMLMSVGRRMADAMATTFAASTLTLPHHNRNPSALFSDKMEAFRAVAKRTHAR